MASFEDHCLETLKKLGNRYEKVHLWLDELFKPGIDHRRFRHNDEAIKQKFTGEELRAAEIHIMQDMGGIPKDTYDYSFGDFVDGWRKM